MLSGRVMDILFALEELVWEALLFNMESCPCVFDVDHTSQILGTFVTSKYQWSRVCGFTTCSSIVSSIEILGFTHFSLSL